MERMRNLVQKGMRFDGVVLNAGVLKYPNVGLPSIDGRRRETD